jgi:hypothetical protein
MVSSGIVSVVVGKEPNKQQFNIHRDLLILHTVHYQFLFSNPEVKTVWLPNFKALPFANFMAWIYAGEITKRMVNLDETQAMQYQYEEPYALGEFLGASSFQNYCLRETIHWRMNVLCDWPSFAEAKYVYNNTKKSWMLRKLVADAFAFRRSRNSNSTHEAADWRELLETTPELSVDINCAPAKSDFAPWADESSERYMLKEQSLSDLWAQSISKDATMDDRTNYVQVKLK